VRAASHSPNLLHCKYITALLLVSSVTPGPAANTVSYQLQTVAGGDYAGDGGPATMALLWQVEGVATDTWGNLYIADAADHRIRKITPSGIITTVAGNGHAGFSGDGGPAEFAQLRAPYGLVVDRGGNLFIADLGNARIRRITPQGIISTVAGGGVTPAAQADGQPATSVALTSPRNVATDFYGRVYFSDFGGNRVYQITDTGKLVLVAGTGEAGFSGDGGPALRAKLNAPAGIAVDAASNLYVADSGNGRVRKISRGLISTLGGGGAAGATSSVPVSMPAGLAIDPDGSLFIADIGGNQILRVTPQLATTPIGQPARDLTIDLQGNLYACSGSTVVRRPRMGDVTIIAGGTAVSYLGDGSIPERVRFRQASAIARDGVGNLYIADTSNHRVRKITPDGDTLTVAGNGLPGFSGDGGPAVGAQLNNPIGVAVDPRGNLYIGDTGNSRIRKVDAAGNITTIAGTGMRGHAPDGTTATQGDLDAPAWLAVAGDGTLFFSEPGRHTVRTVTTNGLLGTVAGTGTRGFWGDGGAAFSAGLDTPQGIALDAGGNVYIADSGNHRIRRVAAPSPYGPPLISTVPDPNSAIWRRPLGLAMASDGALFVTDADDARVYRIDGAGSILTVAGTGVDSFAGESGLALDVALSNPSGLAIDATGAVYLVDAGNSRIRKLTPIIEVAPPEPNQTGLTVVNAASLLAGGIAPGQIVTIFGTGLGPAEGLSAALPATDLGGTRVLMNGHLAPIFYVSQTQINLQVPYGVADATKAEVEVVHNGIVRGRASLPVVESSPAIFTVSGGVGQAAALNEDGSINSPSNPAVRGSVLVLFATGEGKTSPPGVEGRPASTPLSVPVLPVSVKIGGYAATVLYAGAAPGFPGLLQVNVRTPSGFAPPGIQAVTLQIGNAVSPPGVTVALR
jgi:uncharacterized protein (TIGR03437 family)